jgi:hypothetical protein
VSEPSTGETLRELAVALRGAEIPGGCDECNANQTLKKDPDFPSLFHLHIHHDDWWPFLARIEARR